MKKIKNKVIGIFASICIGVSLVPIIQAKEHLILVIPGGGALGKISVASLIKLEEKTQKPIYELFDEYYGSSIGAQIISLLNVPQPDKGRPLTALEVDNFLNKAFQSPFSALSLRENFCAEMGLARNYLLEEAIRPVRIIATKLNEEQRGKELVTFGPERYGKLKLSEIACASSTVLPLMTPQTVQLENGESAFFIDSGCNFCDLELRTMNPLYEGFKDFTRSGKFKEGDTATIFFLGNGWVSLGSEEFMRQVELKTHDNKKISVKLFHINVNIDPILNAWAQANQSLVAMMGQFIPGGQSAQNAAVAGIVPPSVFDPVTTDSIQQSGVFKAMVDHLKGQMELESVEVKLSPSEEEKLDSALAEPNDATAELGMEPLD